MIKLPHGWVSPSPCLRAPDSCHGTFPAISLPELELELRTHQLLITASIHIIARLVSPQLASFSHTFTSLHITVVFFRLNILHIIIPAIPFCFQTL